MNRKDLISWIMKKANLNSSQATKALNSTLEGILDALKRGERVTLSGFGSFEIKIRNPRKGRNPKTGEQVSIPSKKRVKFNPSKTLKDLV